MTQPNGRAITVAQKSRIIDSIFQSWIKCPHQRLGQLIVNAIRSSNTASVPLFYIEDDALETAIVDFANKNEKV